MVMPEAIHETLQGLHDPNLIDSSSDGIETAGQTTSGGEGTAEDRGDAAQYVLIRAYCWVCVCSWLWIALCTYVSLYANALHCTVRVCWMHTFQQANVSEKCQFVHKYALRVCTCHAVHAWACVHACMRKLLVYPTDLIADMA